MATYLKGIVMSFESLAQQKNIRLHFASEFEHIAAFIDPEKTEMVFYNLLSNAFKFTPTGGDVSVMLLEKKEHIEIIIKDTGIGISAEKLPYIFDRFYQAKSTEQKSKEGSGLGLAVAKQLIDLHYGEIDIESTENKGTTFKVLLKKGNAHFNEIYSPPIDEKPFVPNLDPNIIEQNGAVIISKESKNAKLTTLPNILLVEDNNDVRSFIKTQLLDRFNIIEATNGEEGIKKAFEFIPDLVITDAMMPIKDGFEVIDAIRHNNKTSHIPIIMLTALANDDDKIKGLEHGADDFLTKPFKSKELNTRIEKLIEGRAKLRKVITEMPTLKFKHLEGNPADVAFIEKLSKLVEENHSNSGFTAEDLADKMKMSRVHLNRKLNKVTDVSANKFIQQFRLKKSLQLLEEQDMSVADVAHAVGFNSTAYFVKCFREFYGQTPGTVKAN